MQMHVSKKKRSNQRKHLAVNCFQPVVHLQRCTAWFDRRCWPLQLSTLNHNIAALLLKYARHTCRKTWIRRRMIYFWYNLKMPGFKITRLNQTQPQSMQNQPFIYCRTLAGKSSDIRIFLTKTVKGTRFGNHSFSPFRLSYRKKFLSVRPWPLTFCTRIIHEGTST